MGRPSAGQVNLVAMLEAVVNQAIAKAVDPREDTQITWDKDSTMIKLPGIPDNMAIDTAIQILIDRKAADEQEYDVDERIPGMPLDAAHAFVQMLKARYGWVAATTKQTMWGPEPPEMKIVKTGPNPDDFVEVPVGQFKLHDIRTNIETGFARPSNDRKSQFMDFYIRATVDYKDRKVIMDLVRATKEYMRDHSIYRNKAMQLSVTGGQLDSLIQPTFMELHKIDSHTLTLNADVQKLVDTTLMTPIRKTKECRKHKIPLKRGILLYGPFGTGKTLTALVTAKEAIQHGWTYVMVDDVKALAATLEFARQFQPCVVFAEDIDRVVDKKRSDAANDIVNTIDGAVGKHDEVITVLTTNHIEKLPPVMLRPGRLDAIVPINLPDKTAAERLVRIYCGDLLAADSDLTKVGEDLADGKFIPAAIRESAERAKLSMLSDGRKKLTADDLQTAVFGLRVHADLLQETAPPPTPAERLATSLREVLAGAGAGATVDVSSVADGVDSVDGKVVDIRGYSVENHARVGKMLQLMETFAVKGTQPLEVKQILEGLTAVRQEMKQVAKQLNGR